MSGADGHPQLPGEDGQPQPAGATRTPYVGLVPYREEDADFFFGREQETRIVAGNLRASRLTIVYGESGVGKSSLLQAGVIRDLHERVLANLQTPSERAPFAICSFSAWRDDPLRALVDRIWQAAVEATGDEQLPAWQPGQPLLKAVQGWTTRVRTLLVVLDQFEDYFLYHADDFLPRPDAEAGEQLAEAVADEDDPRTFADAFPRIVNDVNLRVHFILAIREDSWAKLDRFEERIPRLFESYLRIEHLDVEAARQAIEGPIEEWNSRMPPGTPPYTVEPALVDAVIAAAATGRVSSPGGGDQVPERAGADSIEAPFLQLVMNRLWVATVQAGSRELTSAQLRALGGAQRIVENHLHDALRSLTRREQGTAADAFRYLVTRTNTKIAHPASDLADWTKRPEPEVTAVLEKLCRGEGGRILRQVHPPGGGETRYELFHDVLAEPILDWRRTYEQRRARRRALGIGSVLTAVIAVFAALGVWALIQRDDARQTARKADAVVLASAAQGLARTRVDQSLLLALEANRLDPSSLQARVAMTAALATVARWGVRGVLSLPGDAQPVTSVAVNPGGELIAVGSADGRVGIFDVAHQRLLGTAPADSNDDVDGAGVDGLAFAPGGSMLATGSGDGRVRLFEISDGRLKLLANAPAGPRSNGSGDGSGGSDGVNAVAFAPGGSLLAAGSGDGRVRLFAVAHGTLRLRADEPSDSQGVSSVAFGPAGATLAAGGFDGVRLFAVSQGMLTPLAFAHAGGSGVDTVAFAGGGSRLVTGSGDGTLRLFGVSPGKLTRLDTVSADDGSADAHGEGVNSVAAGPDRTLVAGSGDGLVRLFATSPSKLTLIGSARADSGADIPEEGDNSVAFATRGPTLVVGSGDGLVRLFDVSQRRLGTLLPMNGGGVSSVAFGPGGSTLATGSGGRVRLLKVSGGQLALLGLAHADSRADRDGDGVRSVAFAPSGSVVATGSGDGRVRLFQVSRGRLKLLSTVVAGHKGVGTVEFAPGGATLAAGTVSGIVQLFSVSPGHHLKPLGSVEADSRADGLGTGVESVAFAPNGATLAAGSGDGIVRLFAVSRGKLTPFARASASNGLDVTSVAFQSDATLASGSNDGTVRLFAISHRKLTPIGTTLVDPQAVNVALGVNSVAFGPGRLLAAASSDGTVRLYAVSQGTLTLLGTAAVQGSNTSGNSVAFAPNRTALAVGGTYGPQLLEVIWPNYARLRRQVCGLVWRSLSRSEWSTLGPPGLSNPAPCSSHG